MPLCYLVHGLGILKPKIENARWKALRRPMLDVECDAIAAAKYLWD
jgi:hypothetical protein